MTPRGRHVLPQRREAPDHLRRELRPLAAVRAPGGHAPAATGRSRSWSTATRRTCRSMDMGESLGVRGTDHAHLVFDRRAGPGRRTASARRARPRGRLRRLPHPEPDRGRDDLRRAGAAGAGAGGRARARRASRSASRWPRARRSPSRWPRTPPTSRPPGSSRCTRRARWEAGAPRRRGAVLDGEADRGRHAHPGHRQGAAGARRHRLLGVEPDRAGLPRRARPALRGGHQRDPEDDHRARASCAGPDA